MTNTPRGIKIDRVFVAAEVGKVIDPENFENQVEGGVIWGLGHAINSELTYKDGAPEQTKNHATKAWPYQAPVIEVRATNMQESAASASPPFRPPLPRSPIHLRRHRQAHPRIAAQQTHCICVDSVP